MKYEEMMKRIAEWFDRHGLVVCLECHKLKTTKDDHQGWLGLCDGCYWSWQKEMAEDCGDFSVAGGKWLHVESAEAQ